MVDWRL
jgi:hypothetical protein